MLKKLLLLSFFWLHFATSVLAETSLSEDKLKALYLFNFSYFVTFPEQCDRNCDEFTICTSSLSNVTEHLYNVVEGEKVGKAPINLRIVNHLEGDFHTCKILFINNNDEQYLYSILDTVKQKPVLTVSDIPNFTAKGGMIGFSYTKKRVVPVVNNNLALGHNLKVSSKLLSIAREVQ